MRHRLIWIVRAIWAAVLGWCIRLVRRLAGKPPRVWHGGFPMHMLRDMVRADRLAGYPGGSLVNNVRLNSAYSLVNVTDFDIVLDERGVRSDEYHWATVCYFLRHADIVVAFFDLYLAAQNRPDQTAWLLAIMRRLGIRTIFVPSGLDVVYESGKVDRYDFIACIRDDYPKWDLKSDTPLIRERLRRYCHQAEFVVSGDAVTERFLPRADIRFKYFPIDTDAFTPSYTTRNAIPVIAHAPNHRRIKGTEYLLKAVSRLQEMGIEVELKLIEKVPPEEARAIYASADLIADQFCIGSFGMFAMEGLALGKPVLAYLDEEHLGDPVFNLPIVNTTPENLTCVLAVLLQLPILRERLGRAGRAAVQSYQSLSAQAEIWSRIYRHVWWNARLELDTTAVFGLDRQPRSFCENPANPDFWPVDVSDLQTGINESLEQLRREPLNYFGNK